MMPLPTFDYLAPETLDEAVSLLAAEDGRAEVLAGGTGLLPLMKQRLRAPERLVSLRKVPGLDSVEVDENGRLRIGAFAALESVADSSVVRDRAGVLAEAAGRVASPQVRSVATLGGNLCLDTRCWYTNQSEFWRSTREACFKTQGNHCHAMPGRDSCVALVSSDLAPALVVLDAMTTAIGRGGLREISVSDFYTGTGTEPTVLEPDEIVSGVWVPSRPARSGSAYLKHSIRDSVDFPLVGVAVFLSEDEDGCCRDVRICVGGVAPAPVRCRDAEEVVVGRHVSPRLVEEAAKTVQGEVRPIVGLFASVSYKRRVLDVLTRRALSRALESISNGGAGPFADDNRRPEREEG